jgi:Tfp pilus assembly protein PilO
MKYSIRNTLILILTLFLLAGGGWLYVQNKFNTDIEEAEMEQERLRSELELVENSAEQFATVQANYNQALYVRLNHPKELFLTHSSSTLYNYMQELNQDISFTGLNYTFRDSVRNSDHGIVQVEIRGEGRYENLVNYIYRLEHSRPLVRVQSVQIENITDYDRLNRVNFQINVGAYYRRGEWSSYMAQLDPSGPFGSIAHNPYFPLIHEVPPNEENLPEVENSRLVVLTGNRAHIIDQTGTLQRLNIGDRVYLGRLSGVNIDRGEAVFQLNRGGISDRVVLTLEQE